MLSIVFQIFIGWYGPFPVSQFEMCCNKTSFNAAHSFMAQNHGNLSIFVHPLTIYDVIDHTERASWMGQPVILDQECPCWYPELPRPKPCPVYPDYSDELPNGPEDYQIPLPGTEDYWHLNKDFDIMKDPY
ncbi:unnamed protein product [Orchesella dallaii]|uniref:Dopa 4,5-dioxygenase n=1 Tax=Orchesella dallaii TaxID=48710 RepID=A0ABP1QKS2_9HEXA